MKRITKLILVLLACYSFLDGTAQKYIDTTAIQTDGYDIPIRIKLPKKTTGKNPVYFLYTEVAGMVEMQRMFHLQDYITM
jgi:hypothetical protein